MEDFFSLLILLGFIFLTYVNVVENYSPGTQLQLMQSRPYYTSYDYNLHEKRLLNPRPYYPYPRRMYPVVWNQPGVYI